MLPIQTTPRRWLLAGLALAALGLTPRPAAAETLTVFAAASLTESMNEIASAWEKSGHDKPRLSYAASSTLARQIEQGAPANLFASADQQWMDYADQRHLLAANTRENLLANQLVLIVPKDRARTIAIGPDLDIAVLLGAGGRLAVGDPANVPAGIYGRQALEKLGLWARMQPRLAAAADVRAAMRLVELGEAPAGIVYATDAAASTGVAVAGVFPETSHDRITYPFAIVQSGDTPQARDFLKYLAGPEARAVFTRRGFSAAE